MPASMKPNPQGVRTYRGMAELKKSYLDTECELKQNTSTEKVVPSISSEQNARKPRPETNTVTDYDNELVKYMSNLPGFLQQLERKSNIQDKALNFGVLDWNRLEKWKYTERMPGKYPSQKQSSSVKTRIGQESKNQSSSSRVRNPSPLYSGKQALASNNCNTQGKTSETRYDEVNCTSECNPSDPKNIAIVEPKLFPRSSSVSSLDEQLAEITGNKLSDFICPRELQSDEFLNSDAVGPNNPETPCKKQGETSQYLTSKERASSPSRRFSFHLGRMSRSLSFHDNSALPQLSSTHTNANSGPTRPEISSNTAVNQAHACSRAKSSPLRRLLDPLLKHRAHRPEVVSTDTKGPSRDRKPDASNLQALFQTSLKNGLPFFKLVVNNSTNMLAASVKRLPTSGKSDSCMVYSFYSVHEIRKKSSNWMNQGSKSKNCGIGYNIVGEMKIYSSSECDSRECVLYSVEPEQVNNKRTLKAEIAAVIVRNSNKMANDGENKKSSGIVVILPDGVHGIPIEGTPSSLVSRFSGMCDCGGWDVGCNLRIIADEQKSSDSCQTSIDHVNLYLEGGKKENKAVFSLKPFSNGYYSVEFDASISLLEAFATCVAYISCLKFPEIVDVKSPARQEHYPEVGTHKRKTATTFQETVKSQVAWPSLSAAGRI